jgi:hypothetical protein
MTEMTDAPALDAALVRQLAALNGLDLSLERAEALVPPLRDLLAVDDQIAALSIEQLPAVGLPWHTGSNDDE